MLLSVVSAMPMPAVAMPTTNVGMPIVAASETDITAPAESSAAVSLLPGAQFGSPSVANRMKRGFWSVSPRR